MTAPQPARKRAALDLGMTGVILRCMKTAISIPDHVFEAAEQLARRLGKSRSELYSAAVASYLERHRQDRVTERLNEVYGPHEERAELDPVLPTLQSLSIPEEEW
jgi:predicted transcriptional regulator